MSTNGNERPAAEATGTLDGLDAVQGIASTVPNDNYPPRKKGPRPRGATTYTPITTDPLEAIREAEGYVVAEVVGDVSGPVVPTTRYTGTWRLGLVGWHA